jgi:hypothetical protein
VSSSSSPDSLAALLRDSLATLEREVPACHGRLVASLTPETVSCRVDRERFSVVFGASAVTLERWRKGAALEIELSRQVVRRLLAGHTSVREALLCDELRVRGTTAALLRLTDGLAAYLHGAVRSPSFPALLHRFHAIAAKDPAHASQARL